TGAPVIDHVDSRVVIVVVQHFDEHAVRILAGRFRSIQPRCRAGPCAGHHQQEKSARAPNHGAGASRTKVWLAVVLRPPSSKRTTRHARRALVMPPPRQYLRRSERVRNIARLAAYRPLSYDAPP